MSNTDALKEPLLSLEEGFVSDASAQASLGVSQQLALKPVQPLSLAWQDVSLTLPPPKNKGRGRSTSDVAAATEPRHILRQVCGEAVSGAVTAILGPTGSGKSSLLNALAGRVLATKGARLSGSITVNGQPIQSPQLAKICAYVVQDDVLWSFLTVLETLTLAAQLHLPNNTTAAQRHAYVMDVINALGLAKAKHTIIGNQRVRGVSGGERKRVSVGVELISNPALLFLDEPTSGLDAFQALSVMGAMQSLAKSGRTIVAAIHQPRSAIFDMIDYLLLLTEGRLVYVGRASEAVSWFSSLGLPCRSSFCPTDHFLDIISMDYRSPSLEAHTRQRIHKLAQAWQSHMHTQAQATQHAQGQAQWGGTVEGLQRGSGFQASWFRQFSLLLGRAFKQAGRNKFAITVRCCSNVFLALIVGALYSRHKDYHHLDQTMIQNFVGALFFVSINQAFSNIQTVLQVFPLEKHIVQKERASQSYRLSAYYLSKWLAELPFNLLGPLLFTCLAYWLIGLQPDVWRFLTFVGVVMLEALCAISLGTLVSAMAPDVPSAMALAPPIMIIFLLVSGVFINVKSLPVGAQWCPDISFVKWTFQALAHNQLSGLTFYGPDKTLTTGAQVLQSYGLETYGVAQCVAAVLGITAIFITAGYVTLLLSSTTYLHMDPPAPTQDKRSHSDNRHEQQV